MNKMKGTGVHITENHVSFLLQQHLKYLQPIYEHVLTNKTGHQKVKSHTFFRPITYNYIYAINPDRRRQYLCLRAVGTRQG